MSLLPFSSFGVITYLPMYIETPAHASPIRTLVLTSPRKHYVDTRLLMPSDASHTITTIDWAFAGTSSTTPATDSSPEHTIWMHWVDSSTADGESVKDEGDMIRLANGEAVERGQMVNPKTGKMEKYEESWIDIRPMGDKIGWVVKIQGQGVRGMVVRIGGFAQGILRKGGDFGIKRWRYVGGDEGWNPIIEIGSLDIPKDIFGEKCSEMAEGDRFLGSDGLEWECVEKFEGHW